MIIGECDMERSHSLTIGEIFDLRHKTLKENDVLSIPKRALAKIYLQELIGLNNNLNYQEVEAAYRSADFRDDVPEGSERFWAYIEKEYLGLEYEPLDKFTEISKLVSDDLSKINKNLQFIVDEKKRLEGKSINCCRLSAEERYYRNQLDYFEKKNDIAKEEIVEFMANGIRAYALRKASSKSIVCTWRGLHEERPYQFAKSYLYSINDPYDVRSVNEYSNKFFDMPISEYRNFVGKCKKSSESFKECSLDYISGASGQYLSAKDKVYKYLSQSHVLDRRRQVIEVIFRHFENKDFISFITITALQIEGIFADICREIGVSEEKLDISSLNSKLHHIDGCINSFIYFEYYSFKFPVLRNFVAHGGLVDADLEGKAINLMLDFLPVCELATAQDLPINHALIILGKASNRNLDSMVEWATLEGKVDIPDFYDVADKKIKILENYSSNEFWEYLAENLLHINGKSEIKKSMPIKVAGILKSKGIAVDRAEKFLKNAPQIVEEAISKRKERFEKL